MFNKHLRQITSGLGSQILLYVVTFKIQNFIEDFIRYSEFEQTKF